MLKILSVNDIENSSLSDSIKKYLISYTQSILSQYQTNSLQKFGCVYFMESSQDTQKHKEMGLSQPLKDAPFEYCELITLNDSHGKITLFHGCHLFSNDYSIDLFGQADIFDQQTLQILLDC